MPRLESRGSSVVVVDNRDSTLAAFGDQPGDVNANLYSPQIPGLVCPGGDIRTITTASGASVNTTRATRVIVPRGGLLVDLCVYVNVQSGNIDVGVYDTGEASAGNRTRLYSTGSIACPAVGWRIVGQPNLQVYAGQMLDFAWAADNATVTIAHAPASFSGNTMILPPGFVPNSSGATAKLAWLFAVFPMPASIPEGSLSGSGGNPMIIARVQ